MRRSHPVDVNEVLAGETQVIASRREAAALFVEKKVDAANNPPSELNTVGLALSGGGIRSGSIAIGFLQAIYQRGILRHIDYMSTVSGGGYAGAFLSSLAMDPKFRQVNWMPSNDCSKRETLDFIGDSSGKQPKTLARLLYAGQEMRDPVHFSSQWFMGVLFLNLWALSGLIGVAALVAYAFRSLDFVGPLVALKELGIVDDTTRALVIPVMGTAVWLVIVSISSRLRNLIPWRGPVFVAICGLWLLGFFTILTIADNSNPSLERAVARPGTLHETVSSWTRQIQTLVIATVFGALLPMLNPRALLRSGTQAKNPIENWLFAIASRAFLFGMPLLIFAYFAKENVSNFNQSRQDRNRVIASHMNDFDAFWRRLTQEFAVSNSPGKRLITSMAEDMVKLATEERNKSTSNAAVPDSVLALKHLSKERAARLGWTIDLDEAWIASKLNPPELVAKESTFKHERELLNLISKLSAIWKDERKRDTRILNLVTRPLDIYSLNEKYYDRLRNLLARDSLTVLLNLQLEQHDFYKKFAVPAGSQKPTIADNQVELEKLLIDAGRFGDESQSDKANEEDLRLLNWNIMIAQYGNLLRDSDVVFASVVIEADQRTRFYWGLAGLSVFGLLGLTMNLNALSLHNYYRWKLGRVWINESPEFGYRIPIAQMTSHERGAPYPLINSAMNFMAIGQMSDRNSTSRFTFSPKYCGSKRTGYVRTDFFADGKLDLADATAISGAAVNPSSVTNPLARTLFLLLNFRLGQWLPNPAKNKVGKWWSAPLRVLFSWLVWKPEDRHYAFVSDGGHDENTGIGALLERRCRIIVALDSSQDGNYAFSDFLKLIRVSAAEHGIEIVPPNSVSCNHSSNCEPIRFNELKPNLVGTSADHDQPDVLKGLCGSHYLIAEIRYPPKQSGDSKKPQNLKSYLIFLKPGLTGDEPTELLHYRNENHAFPHDPTVDQFYEPRRFSCFRQLGEHLGNVMCDELFPEDVWAQKPENDTAWLANRWTPAIHQASVPEYHSTFPWDASQAAEYLRTCVSENYRVNEIQVFETTPFGTWVTGCGNLESFAVAPLSQLLGSQYTHETRAGVRRQLLLGNAKVLDLLRPKDAPKPPDKTMYSCAVDDLIEAFQPAVIRGDTDFQCELVQVISYYLEQNSKAVQFLNSVSGSDAVKDEVRSLARTNSTSLAPGTPKRSPRAKRNTR